MCRGREYVYAASAVCSALIAHRFTHHLHRDEQLTKDRVEGEQRYKSLCSKTRQLSEHFAREQIAMKGVASMVKEQFASVSPHTCSISCSPSA
jgi:hypothetical protein